MGKLTLPDGSTYDTGADADGTYLWDGETVKGYVVKSEPERRYTLCVAYPADKADVAVAQDGHRDFASKAAVEDAAWNYMRKHRAIGADHADGTDGSGDMVESYIYRGPDWTIKAANGADVAVKAGDWLIGTIWTPAEWEKFTSGKRGGMSAQGGAERGVPTAEQIANLRS